MISDNIRKEQNQGMATLSDCVKVALDRGYSHNFRVTTKGLTMEGETSVYTPEDVKIINFYRFDGNSNAYNNSIVYLIETDDRMKGTLIDINGVYSETLVSNFVHRVEDFQKRPKLVF